MCKLVENSYRDVNIAFANELSLICDRENINVWELINLANKHPRVNILQPSTGVGGHCIAVDPWFIIARDNKNTRLIKSAREINDQKPMWAIDQIKNHASKLEAINGKKPKILCLGLSFKPDVDDLRGSPALKVAETLKFDGYEVSAIEPNIDNHSQINLTDMNAIFDKNIVIAVLVKHQQFLNDTVKNKLIKLNALDFCGILN